MTAQVQFFVSAIIQQGERLLMVEQQGPGDDRAYWFLPGGRVEPGELLLDGLLREVREETGVDVVTVGPLAYTARVDHVDVPLRTHARAFRVEGWQGTLVPRDPDGFVRAAEFVPVAAALDRLAELPWRAMREPLLAYLQGIAPRGSVWLYRQERDGEPLLIRRLDAPHREKPDEGELDEYYWN